MSKEETVIHNHIVGKQFDLSTLEKVVFPNGDHVLVYDKFEMNGVEFLLGLRSHLPKNQVCVSHRILGILAWKSEMTECDGKFLWDALFKARETELASYAWREDICDGVEFETPQESVIFSVRHGQHRKRFRDEFILDVVAAALEPYEKEHFPEGVVHSMKTKPKSKRGRKPKEAVNE